MINIGIILTNITNGAGTERAVSNLANILVKNHKVLIISTDSYFGESKYILNSEVSIFHLGLKIGEKNELLKKIYYYYLLINKLKIICSKNNITCLIGTYSLFNVLVTFLPRKIKKIGCEHFNYESAGKIQKILRRIFYSNLSQVVVLTERDKQNYKFLTNCSVIPNSFSFIPSRMSSCEEKLIISVGRLNYQKGYDLLLDIAVLLKEKIPDWHIIIYGDGEEKTKLMNKIQQLNINKFVTIHNFVNEIEGIYEKAGIYISTSRFEGFPMVLLEAQSCGVPAVSFDCPCGPSDIIIENKTGYLVPLGDIKGFADRVLELANNTTKRIGFGKSASESAKRFNTDNISKLWNNLLENLEE
jgi:glycosyltransferase involved in cell wall biosynthesis